MNNTYTHIRSVLSHSASAGGLSIHHRCGLKYLEQVSAVGRGHARIRTWGQNRIVRETVTGERGKS